MKYSIIIPTYNHANDLLKPCLDAILINTSMKDVEVFVVANGCTDNTREVTLSYAHPNIKLLWYDKPLGYAKANNIAIEQALGEYIILLNNDAFLQTQEKDTWIKMLEEPFKQNPNCGVSGPLKIYSEPAAHDFLVFFCVMIKRDVFDKIGYLNEEYGTGSGEDTEFCIEAAKAGFDVVQCDVQTWSEELLIHIGQFPIYHRGEGTVFDTTLVSNWNETFLKNSLILAKKYNPKWYQWKISNNYERAVYFKNQHVDPRETARYTWASENLTGKNILEIGCSNGYGIQFLPSDINYIGLDYDATIIDVAKNENWSDNAIFVNADINNYYLEFYDTIIAFEVIEHIPNGLELIEKLKKHCNTLLISVPRDEPVGFWGPHHVMHNLKEDKFPDFNIKYINEYGKLFDQPDNTCIVNLMLMKWTR